MTRFFKLLEMGKKAVDDICDNYNSDNAKKLESLTQMAQDELVMNAKELLDKYPTDANRKSYASIMNVYKSQSITNRYKYR